VLRCSGVRIETVNQHHAAQLDLDQSPLQFMAFMYPGNGSLEHEGVLRGHLAGCGVTSELQSTLIRGLSGGQRSRCAMAGEIPRALGPLAVTSGRVRGHLRAAEHAHPRPQRRTEEPLRHSG
jgi:hypothetical protein